MRRKDRYVSIHIPLNGNDPTSQNITQKSWNFLVPSMSPIKTLSHPGDGAQRTKMVWYCDQLRYQWKMTFIWTSKNGCLKFLKKNRNMPVQYFVQRISHLNELINYTLIPDPIINPDSEIYGCRTGLNCQERVPSRIEKVPGASESSTSSQSCCSSKILL